MPKGIFWPLQAPLWHWRGPNYGHYGGQNRAIMAGWLQDNDSAWKPFCAPYHTSLHGQTWLRAIFDHCMHPYGTGEVQTMAIMEVIMAGWLQNKDSAWKPFHAPYHIMGVKKGRLWRACFRMRTPFYVPYHTSLHGQSWPEAPTAIFLSRYLSHVWVKSHLSESNLSKKGDQKSAYLQHIPLCNKSA